MLEFAQLFSFNSPAGYQQNLFQELASQHQYLGDEKSAFTPIVHGLQSLANPILVMWREQDDMLPVSQAQIVKEKAPQARVEIFENCKHDPMIVKPQRFNKLLLEFLTE